jgi:hypothetical protein
MVAKVKKIGSLWAEILAGRTALPRAMRAVQEAAAGPQGPTAVCTNLFAQTEALNNLAIPIRGAPV